MAPPPALPPDDHLPPPNYAHQAAPAARFHLANRPFCGFTFLSREAHVISAAPGEWKTLATRADAVLFEAPAVPSPFGTWPAARLVRLLKPGADRPHFAGSDGYVGHTALAPHRTCLRFDPPEVAVEP